ncbi:tetratricopeptide repeat protein, partial [Nitrosospira sp. NpAV]
AQYALGVLYAKGRGVAQDDREAVSWYRKAAEQGNADAQYNLGLAYTKGQGTTQDERQAAFWYLKAAEQESTR